MSDDATKAPLEELLRMNAEAHQRRSEPEPAIDQPSPVVDEEVRRRQQDFAARVEAERRDGVEDQRRVEQLDQRQREQHHAIEQQVMTERQMTAEALRIEQVCSHMRDGYRRWVTAYFGIGAVVGVIGYMCWSDARTEATDAC